MRINMKLTLEQLIQEMNELEQQMQKFEWKYSIKSAEFFKLVTAGKIEETHEIGIEISFGVFQNK